MSMTYLNTVALLLTVVCAMLALGLFATYQRILVKRGRDVDLKSVQHTLEELKSQLDDISGRLAPTSQSLGRERAPSSRPPPSESGSSQSVTAPTPQSEKSTGVAPRNTSSPEAVAGVSAPNLGGGGTLEIKVPNIGELRDISVVRLMVKPGDAVNVDDLLIELEKDKATVDIPAPVAGRIREVKVSEGDKVAEGVLLLLLEAATNTESERSSAGTPGDKRP